MIDFTKGLFQSDSFLKVCLNGNWCNINEEEYPDAWKEAQDWISANKYTVQPETIPMLSTEQQAANARAAIQAQIDALDKQSIPLLRSIAIGSAQSTQATMAQTGQTPTDPATQLADLESQAQTLYAQLAAITG